MAISVLRPGGAFEAPWCVAGFSTRVGGVSLPPFASLNLSLAVGDDPERVISNRRLWFDALGARLESAIFMKQVHGTRVHRVTQDDSGEGAFTRESALDATDALISDLPGVVLDVMVADCQSILYIDPVRKAVGAAHAGWRGTVGGIAAAVVDAMAAEFGCEAHNISAAFGPGIRPCSYEVDAPVYGRAFARLGQRAENCFVLSRPGHWWFDLIRFNQLILEERGVTRFETLGGCTACEADRYFSYRREGAASGRMVASICLS